MKKDRVLQDHKKVGKTLIPPIKHILGVEEFSFINNGLPNLIWISALFLRCDLKMAFDSAIEFAEKCHLTLKGDSDKPTTLLQDFYDLNEQQKQALKSELFKLDSTKVLVEELRHQNQLLENYPLSFLFQDDETNLNRNESVSMLKQDVAALYDRYSVHSVKVEVTALCALMNSGHIVYSSHLNLPDINSVFLDPESDEAKHVGALTRASMNSRANIYEKESTDHSWAKDFWSMAYYLEGCT